MPYQVSISNLSMGLIEMGLSLLQNHAFPVYRKNIDRQCKPPIAHGESTPSSIAVLLITTGIDHHLSRLKYLRDHAPHDPLLPHTPYFEWEIGVYLPTKIENLLMRPREKKLKEQLLEITIVRNSVAHPKFYIVKDTWRKNDSWGKSSATLSPGVKHRDKAKERKRARSERTKLLALPIVSTWICYRT